MATQFDVGLDPQALNMKDVWALAQTGGAHPQGEA